MMILRHVISSVEVLASINCFASSYTKISFRMRPSLNTTKEIGVSKV